MQKLSPLENLKQHRKVNLTSRLGSDVTAKAIASLEAFKKKQRTVQTEERK
jgi:hypothetical protein